MTTLDAFQRRVLGVLIEKSMTQPDYYPMTMNAIVAACNQKSNRNPVMDVDEEVVWSTLNDMREQNLVIQIMPGGGARTERFKHNIEAALGWQPRERAVMAELLLRGPQTPGELRTRCSRMIPFDSVEAVSIVLDCLAGYEPPLVRPLPRAPGQSVVRHTHLLYPADEMPEGTEPEAAPARSTSAVASSSRSQSSEELEALRAEVAELRANLEALTARVAALDGGSEAGKVPGPAA